MGATTLSDLEVGRGLRNVTWFSLMSHVMGTLVGGVFLIKTALMYDASLFVIGLLASLPSLANLAQIPATYLVERYRNRKRIAVFAYIGVRWRCLVLLAGRILEDEQRRSVGA